MTLYLSLTGEGETPAEWNSGSNGYVYFVANNLGGTLTQLPHVTPGQVKASRRIKKLLTGRLASQVKERRPERGWWRHPLMSSTSLALVCYTCTAVQPARTLLHMLHRLLQPTSFCPDILLH
jgi:hypothetical protein